MRSISESDWDALKRDIGDLCGLSRVKMTKREANALSRLARLKRKMDRKDNNQKTDRND